MNTKNQSPQWARGFLITFVAPALLFLFALPTLAISYGEPDGDSHPNVGAIVLRVPDGQLFNGCSGTLISDYVFMTAAHCTAILDGVLASNPPGSEILVTFDPTVSETGTFYTGTWYTNPNYNGGQGKYGASDTGDVGVIILNDSPGITPASLPTAGLLDDLKDSHVLKDTRFTAVGYGTIREVNTTGPAGILANSDRNSVNQGFLALTKAWIRLPMTLTTGNGGTCYGDSGGPHFVHLNGEETNTVASITVSGDVPCVAMDQTYRVDTDAARSFLGNFVNLP